MSDSDSDSDYKPRPKPISYEYPTQKPTFSGPLIVINGGSTVQSYLGSGSTGYKIL